METRSRISINEAARGYVFPITRTLVTATTEGTAQTIATMRDQALGQVKRLAVGNQTAAAASLTVYFVPEGGTIGAANREITALSVSANSNVDLTDLIGGVYEPGTTIRVFASTGSALIVMGHIKALF